MKPSVLRFKDLSIPVTFFSSQSASISALKQLFLEHELNFDFRKKLKKISSIEMVGEVAIFKYHDGTKLYMEVC